MQNANASANGNASANESFALAIENYALIGNCRTGALIGNNGSIDWLCWPRFDGDACFAALLGSPRHGRWLMAPASGAAMTSRQYRSETMILETLYETSEGAVLVIDYMPTGAHDSIIRIVQGVRGTLKMKMQLRLRFDYGSSKPWITQDESECRLTAVAGPHCVTLDCDVKLELADATAETAFDTCEGVTRSFVLTWGPSHLPPPAPTDVHGSLVQTETFWRDWAAQCTYRGEWRCLVVRSLLTLKALTFQPTGGIVAALTTSLPEKLGGERNWDYRYCWLRDATLTLAVFIGCGYEEEAAAWQAWLQRSIGGDPATLQNFYGVAGERRLAEWSPAWLPGYQGSMPVRIGNAAANQLQIDVYGEIAGAMYMARKDGSALSRAAWQRGIHFMEHLESVWDLPDESIWEVRSEPRHFTYSKVMAWAAFDRAIRSATADAATFDFPETLERWRVLRDRIHAQVCAKGFDASRRTFTQSYGSPEVDAALLLIPLTGFLPIDDPRIEDTVEAIEQDLLIDGLVMRYRTTRTDDGLPDGEGAFLPCSFWLVDVYTLQGRHQEARVLFERLIGLCNDLGLLAEEYSVAAGRQLGNFPQAFSHLSLIASALYLDDTSVHWRQSLAV